MNDNAELIKELQTVLQNMQDFCLAKRDMFMSIRDELEEARKVVTKMNSAIIHAKWYYGFIR